MKEDILKIVTKINNDLIYSDDFSEKFLEETFYSGYQYPLCLKSTGDIHLVEFMGFQFWDSENDERDYLDEDWTIQEDLETYFRKKIKEIIKNYMLILEVWNKEIK